MYQLYKACMVQRCEAGAALFGRSWKKQATPSSVCTVVHCWNRLWRISLYVTDDADVTKS